MSNVNFIVIEREVGKTGVTELKFGTCAKTQRETQTFPKQTVPDIINVIQEHSPVHKQTHGRRHKKFAELERSN